MTRTEQEQKILENVPKVYEAGRSSISDKVANALKGSAVGEVVVLPDVSELEHRLGVEVASKNLLDMSEFIQSSSALVNSAISYDNSTIRFERINTEQYTPSIGWIAGNSDDFKGKTLTLSFNLEEANTRLNTAVLKGNPFTTNSAVTINQKSFETTETGHCTFSLTVPNEAVSGEPLFIRFYLNRAQNVGDYIKISNVQLERGATATPYTPFVKDIEAVKVLAGASEDDLTEYEHGAAIKSIYPTTVLTTDTQGAVIEVNYNRDINKAFAELQQAIISLGGNV